MFDFEYFIRRKDVVKRWIDTNLAKGLLEDAKDRFPFGERILDEKLEKLIKILNAKLK